MTPTAWNTEPLSSLVLAGNEGTTPRMVDAACRRGVNAFFFYNLSFQGMVAGVRQVCARSRERVFVATGTESRGASEMRDAAKTAMDELGTNYLDTFCAEYCSPSDDESVLFGEDGALATLDRLRSEGLIRYRGASVHNRELAVRLVADGRIDIVMHRYNMAHRKSEAEVLPAADEAGVPVAAFTCTRWGSLLEGHPGWTGPVPRAGDCYRFCLTHPSVRLALMAPASMAELTETLNAVEEGPATAEEMAGWRGYGDLIYGEGGDAFETKWP